MENKKDISYLKKSTKNYCIASSVFAAISLIIIAIISFLVEEKEVAITICAFGSAFIMVVFNLMFGSAQLQVSNDYKTSKKFISTDGIISVSISIIIIITLWIFLIVLDSNENASKKLVVIISALFILYSISKFVLGFNAMKEKRFNWMLDILLAGLWLVDGIVILFMDWNDISIRLIIFAIVNFAIIVATVLYLLFTYVYNNPSYLESKESLALLEAEEAARIARIARYNEYAGKNITIVQPPVQGNQQNEVEEVFSTPKTSKLDPIEIKLAKLDSLLTKHIITEEEYQAKRKKILDEEI